MKRLGLIGHHLDHSKSPKLHQLIAQNLNRKMTYQLFDVAHISEVELLLNDLRSGIYHGLNITIPYKEAVLPYLDKLTPKAQQIGAVNTVYLKDNQLIGDNTDYDGFKFMFEQLTLVKDVKDIIILGSGGAAKACYCVCKDLGFDPVIVSRNPNHKTYFDRVISYAALKDINFDLLIQTTPIGTYPNIDASPIDLDLIKEKAVIDLIYNPPQTKVMKSSNYAIGGIDMLIIQALKAQNIWFNESIELDTKVLNRMRKDVYE